MMDDNFLKKLGELGVTVGFNDLHLKPRAVSDTQKLQQLLGGYEFSNMFGSSYRVDKSAGQPYTHGRIPLDVHHPVGWVAKLQNLPTLIETPLDQILYLDIETTSLSNASGTLPFLIGLCRVTGDQLTTMQLFMRSPEEEKAALVELIRLVEAADALVTYNGASFDLEILRSRLRYHRLPDPFSPHKHLDLLHVTRKLWKNTLPSRSLGYIEMSLLGVARREIEIPGSQIPQLYFDYLRAGEPSMLPGILYHNEVDIISLAALLIYLLGPDPVHPSFDAIHQVDPAARERIIAMLSGNPIPPPAPARSPRRNTLSQKEIQTALTMIGNQIKENSYAQALDSIKLLREKVAAANLAPFSRNRVEQKISARLEEIESRSGLKE